MYKAIITRVNIKPHTNSDNLEILVVDSGEQVITRKGQYKNGDKVIYLQEGGCLSHEYCFNNSEYRENHGINKDPKKFGFFEEKRRVKIIKLRGEYSNGYCTSYDAFEWLGEEAIKELESMPVGTEFDTVANHQFCSKYFTKATRDKIDGQKQNKINPPKIRYHISGFQKHFDTSQISRHYKNIPDNAVFYISEKIHSQSGRTAFVTCTYTKPEKSTFDKIIRRIYNFFGINRTKEIKEDMIVSGSRNVDFNPLREVVEDNYRKRAENLFRNKLKLGETVYYELCYVSNTGKAIQHGSVNPKEEIGKDITKKYGQHMEFTYGLQKNEVKVFVYRITQNVANSSRPIELSHVQMEKRISEISDPNVCLIPFYGPFCSKSEIDNAIKTFIGDGKSKLDNHLMEGVCLRIEHPLVPANMSILKYKTPEFCYMEGIQKNDDNFIDPEEAS